jgi:DNA-binding XRE family transcriptional regulator
MTVSKKELADLRLVRIGKGLTQAQVAAKLKVSQSYYSQIERGQRPKEVTEAVMVVADMRRKTNRTSGGTEKAGRIKG